MATEFVDLDHWDRDYLALAHFWAKLKSKDPSSQVGAVVADVRHRVKGMGYNGFPRGVIDDVRLYQDRDEKLKRIVHAELNALADAGDKCNGSTLYVASRAPCTTCAGMAIQMGIARVLWQCPANNRWNEVAEVSKEMFDQANVKWYEIHE